MSQRHHREIVEGRHRLYERELQHMQDETQKPVAYDAEGRPLYAAPVVASNEAQSNKAENEQQSLHDAQQSGATADSHRGVFQEQYGPAVDVGQSNDKPPYQVVHMARAVDPEDVEVPPEVKRRHEESIDRYPGLNLSHHEYIISAVRRHPIGMLMPLIAVAMVVTMMFIFMLNYPYIAGTIGLSMDGYPMVILICVLMTCLFLIGGYLAMWVYMNNRFFLTNESVIQEIQSSLFARREQTVSLMNIEDASYTQSGPLQTFLDYGSIRLSTEGDETTYRFDYVSHPKKQIAILNNAVEAFKNGRPVESDENNKN